MAANKRHKMENNQESVEANINKAVRLCRGKLCTNRFAV